MSRASLAYIIFLDHDSDAHPSHPIAPGGPPPVAGWTPPGYRPTHPIAPGGRPPGIWGGGGVGDYIDAGFPGPQPGRPPGIWGGAPPWVDNTLPGPQPGAGRPTPPIYYPPEVSHPIVLPPGSLAPGIPSHPIYWPPYPDNSLPGQQPGIDNTLPGNQPIVSHPIVIPGDDETNPKFEVKTAWSPQTGWVTVIVPTGDVVTPSTKPAT